MACDRDGALSKRIDGESDSPVEFGDAKEERACWSDLQRDGSSGAPRVGEEQEDLKNDGGG